jgi:hypothetical protein
MKVKKQNQRRDEKMRFFMDLKGKSFNKKAEVVMTYTAEGYTYECDLLPLPTANLVADAPDFFLGLKEGERFALVSKLPKVVLCGFVSYIDDEEIEVIITSIYKEKEVYVLENKFQNVESL